VEKKKTALVGKLRVRQTSLTQHRSRGRGGARVVGKQEVTTRIELSRITSARCVLSSD
jgi:hypothetical protein